MGASARVPSTGRRASTSGTRSGSWRRPNAKRRRTGNVCTANWSTRCSLWAMTSALRKQLSKLPTLLWQGRRTGGPGDVCGPPDVGYPWVAASAGVQVTVIPVSLRLSQTCLCGTIARKSLAERVHRCACGIVVQRDGTRRVSGAYLARFSQAMPGPEDPGWRLDAEQAQRAWSAAESRLPTAPRGYPVGFRSRSSLRGRQPKPRMVAVLGRLRPLPACQLRLVGRWASSGLWARCAVRLRMV